MQIYTYNENPMFCIIIGIILLALFAVALPVLNVFSGKFMKPRKDIRNGEEIEVSNENKIAISRVLVKGNDIYLKRNSDIQHVIFDILYFVGNKWNKVSYDVVFKGDYAVVNAGRAFDSIKLIVLTADNKRVQNKVYGYPNSILTIVASITLALGVAGSVIIPALDMSRTLVEYQTFSLQYGINFYVIPSVVGVILGVLHFVLVKVITNSFNKGGR